MAEGTPLIASAIRHMTDRKTLEQRLREREWLADLGTAAAIFAHEIGNPLASIRLAAQSLQEVVPREYRKEGAILLAEIDRLVLLLEDFISLKNVSHLRAVSLNLVDIVDGIVKIHQRAWLNQGVRVLTRVSQRSELRGDPAKLEQVLLNLCKNAVEAMPAGGILTLTGERRGEDIVLEVRDTGSGVPEGIDMFELFATTKPNGAGLGLYIVRQIVGAHSGTVSYVSEPGKGTTFQVHLPARDSLEVE